VATGICSPHVSTEYLISTIWREKNANSWLLQHALPTHRAPPPNYRENEEVGVCQEIATDGQITAKWGLHKDIFLWHLLLRQLENQK
jgi:hypothetical protein